ncbi:MAG: response regulator [Bdellovibrionota bacterium]|nr:response regulator [Bdellovibrionota bacterium]
MINILVVDDSLTIRIKFKDYLSDHGFNVHEASNGMEALELLKRNSEIKLIISDLNMPDMDGMTFIEFVRQAENGKDIPIMIYSTELDKKLKEDAKKLGVNAWVSKPLDQSKILTAIKGLLEKKGVS